MYSDTGTLLGELMKKADKINSSTEHTVNVRYNGEDNRLTVDVVPHFEGVHLKHPIYRLCDDVGITETMLLDAMDRLSELYPLLMDMLLDEIRQRDEELAARKTVLKNDLADARRLTERANEESPYKYRLLSGVTENSMYEDELVGRLGEYEDAIEDHALAWTIW